MTNVALTIRGLSQGYDDKTVLRSLDLDVMEGEILAVLGPSGCGKTTLLKAIAGLVPIDRGAVSMGDRRIETLPPQGRNVAMIFQHYALFPHMSVLENIVYGLKVRKVGRTFAAERAAAALRLVRMNGYEHRAVSTLSGGQQQRVAIGRALIIEPKMLLLDEPLSNLDERLRSEMRTEIRNILKAARTTSVYVTHDQDEAMAIADRIVVMKEGEVEQVAAPDALYRGPRSEYVARFIGYKNIFPVDVEDGAFSLFGIGVRPAERGARGTGRRHAILPAEAIDIRRGIAAPVSAAPVRLAESHEDSAHYVVTGVLEAVERQTTLRHYRVAVDGGVVHVTTLNRCDVDEPRLGETVVLEMRADDILVV